MHTLDTLDSILDQIHDAATTATGQAYIAAVTTDPDRRATSRQAAKDSAERVLSLIRELDSKIPAT